MTRFTGLVVLEGWCRLLHAVNFRELSVEVDALRWALTARNYSTRGISAGKVGRKQTKARSSSSTTQHRTLSAIVSRHCAVCDFYGKTRGIPCRTHKNQIFILRFFFYFNFNFNYWGTIFLKSYQEAAVFLLEHYIHYRYIGRKFKIFKCFQHCIVIFTTLYRFARANFKIRTL